MPRAVGANRRDQHRQQRQHVSRRPCAAASAWPHSRPAKSPQSAAAPRSPAFPRRRATASGIENRPTGYTENYAHSPLHRGCGKRLRRLARARRSARRPRPTGPLADRPRTVLRARARRVCPRALGGRRCGLAAGGRRARCGRWPTSTGPAPKSPPMPTPAGPMKHCYQASPPPATSFRSAPTRHIIPPRSTIRPTGANRRTCPNRSGHYVGTRHGRDPRTPAASRRQPGHLSRLRTISHRRLRARRRVPRLSRTRPAAARRQLSRRARAAQHARPSQHRARADGLRRRQRRPPRDRLRSAQRAGGDRPPFAACSPPAVRATSNAAAAPRGGWKNSPSSSARSASPPGTPTAKATPCPPSPTPSKPTPKNRTPAKSPCCPSLDPSPASSLQRAGIKCITRTRSPPSS